jgi:hypothetical protein
MKVLKLEDFAMTDEQMELIEAGARAYLDTVHETDLTQPKPAGEKDKTNAP